MTRPSKYSIVGTDLPSKLSDGFVWPCLAISCTTEITASLSFIEAFERNWSGMPDRTGLSWAVTQACPLRLPAVLRMRLAGTVGANRLPIIADMN